MPDFPRLLLPGQTGQTINAGSACSLGAMLTGSAAAVWPSASRAIFVPFRITERLTVYQFAIGTGTTATGNFDVGIYDFSGNLIGSTGATAKSVASGEIITNCTDFEIGPGRYYLAQVADAATQYMTWSNTGNLAHYKLMGDAGNGVSVPAPVDSDARNRQQHVLAVVLCLSQSGMSDFPNPKWEPLNVITPWHPESMGSALSSVASAANFVGSSSQALVANQAFFFPFRMSAPAVAIQMSYLQGAAAVGNVDVGIYDAQWNEIVSSGSVAQGTISVLQTMNITDTLLLPGEYYMAIEGSGSGTRHAVLPADEVIQGAFPVYVQAVGSFPLPATATPTPSVAVTPFITVMGVHFDSLI